MTDDDAIDIGEDTETRKRRTTYNREHPVDNPKPPKRSKAEIQAAAAEKRATAITKKKEKASLQATVELDKQKKRQMSVKDVAATEDAIQRKQRHDQLQAERPDLQTMKTYQTIQEAHVSLAMANASTTEEIPQDTDVEMPPQSIIDTDSDGGLLGVEKDNFNGEDEDGDDMYIPAVDKPEDDSSEEEEEDTPLEQGNTSQKKKAEKEKVRIRISKEFISIYSQVVDYQRESYVQKFKPIARLWHQPMPQ